MQPRRRLFLSWGESIESRGSGTGGGEVKNTRGKPAQFANQLSDDIGYLVMHLHDTISTDSYALLSGG